MEQKEPIKIEYCGKIRWIMELFLVVLALSTTIGHASANDNGFVNYDWKIESTDHIGQFDTAPQGSKFVLATLYLQNYSNGVTVAPDPGSWILVVDNVTYSEVLETYDNSMGYSNMPIPYGGGGEPKVIYQVPRNSTHGYIKHNGPFTWEPTFIYVNHYALSQSSNSNEVIKADDKVLGNNLQNSTGWYDKGVELDDLNKFDEALKAYDKAIEINPRNADAWNNKGIDLDNLNKSDEAIKTYDKSIEINPYDPTTLYNKGFALDKLKKYDEAIRAFDKAIEINPQYSDALKYKKIVNKVRLNKIIVKEREDGPVYISKIYGLLDPAYSCNKKACLDVMN
jgi:tetratricopeptide (TPR) repeat protein